MKTDRRIHRIAFLLLVLAVPVCRLLPQQFPPYSQYTFNRFLLNPAAAGSDGYTSVSLVAREQWVGFQGTPKTHAVIIDSRILPNSYIEKEMSPRRKKRLSSRSGKVGWAAHVFNDHTALLDRTGVEGTYSYHLRMVKGQLSFGLSGTFYQFRLNQSKAVLADDESDPLIDGAGGTLYVPDAHAGIYYNSSGLHGGISLMNLFQSSIQFGDKDQSEYRTRRMVNLMTGYMVRLSENVRVEPAVLVKIPARSKAQLDLTARLYYRENYWAGLSYRTGNAMIFFLGARIERIFIGYAFDYNFNSLMHYTYGTHEFMAAVKFGENARRYKWLNTY